MHHTASMEANGTWPTHIAQLLFSGLGAASLSGSRSNTASRAARPHRDHGASAAASTSTATSSLLLLVLAQENWLTKKMSK